MQMRVLWLGPSNDMIKQKLFEKYNDTIIFFEEKLQEKSEILDMVDFIVSFGYRYLIPAEIINMFKRRTVNLHISYLPWNRGADPNFWSIVEDTKKGVTIHYVDENLDTGDIIVQKEVALENSDTLRTSYERLIKEIEELFIREWINIRTNINTGKAQDKSEGSFHYVKDKKKYADYLDKGWDTPVLHLIGIAKKHKENNDENTRHF